MTRAEIFIQIISEVSGKSAQENVDLLGFFRKAIPGGTWDEEIPPDQAEQLINELRKEAPVILAWLFRGRPRNG